MFKYKSGFIHILSEQLFAHNKLLIYISQQTHDLTQMTLLTAHLLITQQHNRLFYYHITTK